jgi:hypothetical protein
MVVALLRSEYAVESVAQFVIPGTVWRYDKGPRGVRYTFSLDATARTKGCIHDLVVLWIAVMHDKVVLTYVVISVQIACL